MLDRLRPLLFALAALAPVLAQGAAPIPETRSTREGTLEERTIEIGETTREYLLHLPVGLKTDSEKTLPLVIMMHGRSSNMSQASSRYYGWRQLADREGFVVAFPNAVGRPKSWRPAWGTKSADAPFLSGLIDALIEELPIDSKKVFLTGHSSGGIMSFSFAATHSDKVAAIAPVAGTIGYGDVTIPKPKSPVPVLSIHGTADRIVPHDSEGAARAVYGELVTTPKSMAFWVEHNRCEDDPEERTVQDGRVRIETWKPKKDGALVELHSVIDGSHGWPGMRRGAYPATKTIWAFFERVMRNATSEEPEKQQVAARPNIIYILLDDAGYGDLGSYGQQKLATPHMDRLAKEGMRFTQHYAGSTVCAPTRSVLMTGLHTGHTPVRGNGRAKNEPENVYPIGGDTITIAKRLKDAGYATGAFGKWGLGGPGSDSDALALGFDHFCGFYNQAFAHDFYPRWLWRDGEKLELNREKYAHTVYFDAALEFVRAERDGPFFCYLPVTIPHAAMQAPAEYHERFREQYPQFDEKTGRYGGDARQSEVQNPIAGFAAMMTKLDDDIGVLLATLKELGLDENTIVMLSSDNGPHREGGHDPEFWNSNGPFRGLKRDLYDGGIRVPMLARWPGKIAPGSVSEHLSAHWDLYPSLCELAGLEAGDGLDGLSFVPTLLGREGQQQHDYLYWEFFERGGRQALRFDEFKAVRYGLNKNPDAPIQIYDLSSDPGETTDLATERPDLVERARELFAGARTEHPQWSFGKRR